MSGSKTLKRGRTRGAGGTMAPGTAASSDPMATRVLQLEARNRDLEQQLAEAHAQLVEAMKTVRESAQHSNEAAKRVLAVERARDPRPARPMATDDQVPPTRQRTFGAGARPRALPARTDAEIEAGFRRKPVGLVPPTQPAPPSGGPGTRQA